MQVRADGIRGESLAYRRDRQTPPEATVPVAEIEYNAAVARLPHEVLHALLVVQDRDMLGVHVRVDVAGAHSREQLGIGACGARPEVDHADGVAEFRGA